MKLLFDQNLSRRLVVRLVDLAPDSTHVVLCGLDQADDRVIWQYACDHGFHAIITKDIDFNDLPAILGTPPKTIHLGVGNCTTADVEALLRAHWTAITTFLANPMLEVLQITAIP